MTANPLIGHWRLTRSHGEIDLGEEGVTLDFDDAGNLTYTIYESDKQQIMELTYEIDDNYLITDQPSHPQRERTSFVFENGLLLLDYGSSKAWFKRVGN